MWLPTAGRPRGSWAAGQDPEALGPRSHRAGTGILGGREEVWGSSPGEDREMRSTHYPRAVCQGRNPQGCPPWAWLGLGLTQSRNTGGRLGSLFVSGMRYRWPRKEVQMGGPGGLPGRGILAGERPGEGVAGGTAPWGGTLVRSLRFTFSLSTEDDRWGPPDLLPPL